MDGKIENLDQNTLKRGLKSRHLVMIAIGGCIADGLFLATGNTLNVAGGFGAMIAYAVIGVMVYFMINSLGEMSVYLPVPGSFSTFSSKYVNPAFGFAVGWNYWFSWAIVIGIEMVVAAILMSYWFPTMPPLIWSILFLVVLLVINLLSARVYGETEYWFAGIKILAVLIFIVVGVLMVAGVVGNPPKTGLANFTAYGGLFPTGFIGVITCMFTAVYAFLGTELIGIASGETAEPEKNIPKAVKTVFWRILLFYIGAVFVMGALLPYKDASVLVSPFTVIFTYAGIPYADSIMNFVVLTAVLSCANSALYASSRMLYSIAREGRGPKIFMKTNKRGVPVPAVILTASLGGFAFLTNLMGIDRVYLLLVSASGLATIFSWFGISLSHYRFRGWLAKNDIPLERLQFKAKWYPFGPILTAFVCLCTLIGTIIDTNSRMTALVGIPIFIVLILVGLSLQKKGRLREMTEEELRNQSVEIN